MFDIYLLFSSLDRLADFVLPKNYRKPFEVFMVFCNGVHAVVKTAIFLALREEMLFICLSGCCQTIILISCYKGALWLFLRWVKDVYFFGRILVLIHFAS